MKFFKDYKSNPTITLTPDSIATQLVEVYGTNINNLYGEGVLDAIKHSSLDNFGTEDEDFVSALYYLNFKLEATRKTISFWDAYQIRETMDNKENLLGQLSSMPVNSSIVSNLRVPFTWLNELNEEETVYRGDLFIKNYDGRVFLVHGTSQGWYKPSTEWVSSGDSYSLTYTYTENDSSDVITSLTLNDVAPQGYNISKSIATNASDTFTYVVVDANTKIAPVVKYYTNSKELVFLDESYEVINNGATCQVTNPTSVVLTYEVK